ncbi:MAG: PAS domain-containing protein [Candidatus Riflebacteria bacterium]|nr:PAS domain-containing protein [Candidatus Riflebacteria bacterium]
MEVLSTEKLIQEISSINFQDNPKTIASSLLKLICNSFSFEFAIFYTFSDNHKLGIFISCDIPPDFFEINNTKRDPAFLELINELLPVEEKKFFTDEAIETLPQDLKDLLEKFKIKFLFHKTLPTKDAKPSGLLFFGTQPNLNLQDQISPLTIILPFFSMASRIEHLSDEVANKNSQLEKEKFLTDEIREDIRVLSLELEFQVQERARSFQRNSRNFNITLNSIADAVITTDSFGKIVRINQAAELITGWSQFEACGKPIQAIMKIVSLKDRTEIPNPVSPVLTTRKRQEKSEAAILISKNGQERIISETASPIIDDEEDEFFGVILVFRDITNDFKLKESLKKSEERYRFLIDNLEQNIFYKDLNSKYIYCNLPYARFLKIKPEEITGKNDFDFFPKEFAEKYRADDKKFISEGTSHTVEEKVVQGSKEFWVLTTKTPVRDENGQIIGLLGIFHDITEKKVLEDQIKNMNQFLEARVMERTSQLEATNKELESFCYSVSHDLRAPLRGIDGISLALIEDFADQFPAEAQEYLKRIRTATQRMGQLIDDLLKLSRITRAGLVKKIVDISQIANTAKEHFLENSLNREIEFVIRPGVYVNADPDLIRVVMDNLISNAFKFTAPRKKARIEFGTIELEGEKILFVQDNGVGFDMAYVGKLFGAFQRLHGINEFEGTGIGLATVQRIVMKHGGRVWAEGAPNRGAAFYFTLE